MNTIIRVLLAGSIAIASLGVFARPPDGVWLPDLALTQEKLTRSDPASLAKICSNIRRDGFYLLSLLLIVQIDGDTLQVRSVGGGPSQTAHLQSEDTESGRLLYRSLPNASEVLEVAVLPSATGLIQVHVAQRNNPELNFLYWVPKTKVEVARMDADLLAGRTGILSSMATVCP